jgi:integrase/recombinase XerD
MTDLVTTTTTVINQIRALNELVARYLLELQVTPNSKITYGRGMKKFCTWLTANPPERMDHGTLVKYRNYLLGQKLSSLTVNSYISAVRSFFAWAEVSGVYVNVASKLKGQRKAKGFLKDALSPEQVWQLLSSIDRGNIIGIRDHALINLLVRSGLRTIETARLLVKDVRSHSGTTILLVQGKNRSTKDDFVVLTPSALAPIQEYLRARGDVTEDEPLFTSHSDRNAGGKLSTRTIRDIVKSRLRDIGIDDQRISAHSLRHTCISLAIQGGASLLEAQQMARHSSSNTTMIYVHTSDRVNNSAEYRVDQVLADVSPETRNYGSRFNSEEDDD